MEFFVYSEDSILIKLSYKTENKIFNSIFSVKKKIELDFNKYITDSVQSINSLLIIFKKNKISSEQLIKEIKDKGYKINFNKLNGKIWEIPVCYDPVYAKDLEEFSKSKNISSSDLIKIHKSKIYDLLSMGFLPGFMYLGQTDKQLHCERKLEPSLDIKKGSIGLALDQTCIYPQDSPGGWHIIGVSPLNFFDIESKSPCFAQPGDKIEFVEISIKQYELMKKDRLLKPNFR